MQVPAAFCQIRGACRTIPEQLHAKRLLTRLHLPPHATAAAAGAAVCYVAAVAPQWQLSWAGPHLTMTEHGGAAGQKTNTRKTAAATDVPSAPATEARAAWEQEATY
jgi:hypothetical protein